MPELCFRKIHGPFLVVIRNSLMDTQIEGIQSTCPTLQYIAVHGNKSERSIAVQALKNHKWDLCIATCETTMIEKVTLQRQKWECVIIDEAGRIKCERNKLGITLRTFETVQRIMLTGTPIQVNLISVSMLSLLLSSSLFSAATVCVCAYCICQLKCR